MNRIVLSIDDNFIILFFEVPYFVTGKDNARLGINNVSSLEDFKIGVPQSAGFDGAWSLTFDEAIDAYHKDEKIGTYKSKGILKDSSKCNFNFESNILEGEWKIDYGETPKKRGNLFSKISINNMGLRITRIK